MKEEFKVGDFVKFIDTNKSSHLYMVVSPKEGINPNIGGLTYLARWYRTDLLEKTDLIEDLEDGEELLSNDARFNFDERLINVLRAENVFTLAELLKHSESDLIKFPNLGRVSIKIIKEQLLEYDLHLAGKRSKK